MAEKKDSPRPSGLALVPFAVFAAFYVGLSLYADHLGFEMPWYKVSMPVAFLVASASSLVLGRRFIRHGLVHLLHGVVAAEDRRHRRSGQGVVDALGRGVAHHRPPPHA